jgi:hypothetical protein
MLPETKSSKPSPYDNGYIMSEAGTVRDTNNRPSARAVSRNSRDLPEQSPYGSSYARYRVSHDNQRMVASQSQISRKKTPRLTAMRRRIEEYSSKVALQHGVMSKSKALGTSSLPSIYKEKRIINNFNSDLAFSRNRMLGKVAS